MEPEWELQQVFFDGNGCPEYCDIEGFNSDDCDCVQETGCLASIDVDPLFVDPDGADNVPLTYKDNDYQLICYSPCVDKGDPDEGVIPPDDFDVDFDNMGDPDTEPTPDLALHDLRVQDAGDLGADVDIGAYEVVQPSCPYDCQAVPDNIVGINDFLALLAQWGQSCDTASASCDRLGPEGVGIEDFLALLALWGPCGEASGGPVQSVEDCINKFSSQPVVLAECICKIDPCAETCPAALCN